MWKDGAANHGIIMGYYLADGIIMGLSWDYHVIMIYMGLSLGDTWRYMEIQKMHIKILEILTLREIYMIRAKLIETSYV